MDVWDILLRRGGEERRAGEPQVDRTCSKGKGGRELRGEGRWARGRNGWF